jgi:hypothetical protein
MEIKLSNRKKCIGEYIDLYHIFNPNYSKKYEKYYKENQNLFKNYKGRFTHGTEIAIKTENMLNLLNYKEKNDDNKTRQINKNEFSLGNKTIKISKKKSFENSNFDQKFKKSDSPKKIGFEIYI